MAIKKNDFVEVEFTGNITGTDEIFDTNIEKDAKKAGMKTDDIKPFVLAVGQKMLPTGFDKDLIGKEAGKKYTLDLKPEDAFGKRNPQMVRMIPTKHFYEQKINPEGKPYNEITSFQTFSSYEEAKAYVSSQKSENYRIVGTKPFSSPVSLGVLEHYKLIYASKSQITRPGVGKLPLIKIFEYIQ